MKLLKGILSKAFIALSISAVLLLFYNDAANWHYHLLQDGTLIRHAHPYTPNPDDHGPFRNHKHSQNDFIFFAQFSLISVLTALLLVLATPLYTSIIAKITTGNKVFPLGVVAGMPSLRAPPVIV